MQSVPHTGKTLSVRDDKELVPVVELTLIKPNIGI